MNPITLDLPLLEDATACGVWALDTYKLCEFRCVYCITGAQGPSVPRFDREHVVEQLRDELANLPPEMPIAVGALCDAYPDVEADLYVTHDAIAELVRLERRFSVITKGTTALRDRDLFCRGDALVTVSLSTVDEAALRRIDPKAPSAAARIALVHALERSGVEVTVSATPWIPDVTDAAQLVDAIGDDITICFGPLNVTSANVAASPYGRRFSQREVNERYLAARQSFGERRNVTWLTPIPLEARDAPHPFTRLTS